MKTLITSLASKMGNTEHGSAWCLKALHPADPLVEAHGIPDENAGASVFLNYQASTRLSFPTTASGVWNLNFQMLPSPVGFAWYRADDGAGNYGAFTAIVNSNLGTTIQAAATAWRGLQCRWRLAYAGLTMHFDGSALNNQGSVLAGQVPYEPRKFYTCVGGLSVGTKASLKVLTPLGTQAAPGLDYPNYDTVVTSPNVYSGEIRDGLYMPLKLTRTHQKWHNSTDETFWSNASDAAGAIVAASNSTTLDFPFPGATVLNNASGVLQGTQVPPMGSDVVGNICVKNMSQTAGIVCMFRYGFEVQVLPGSTYAPMQEVAVTYDPLATETYFNVSRTLKDAYPESYNDLGKLRDVILKGLKLALPVLQAMPGPVGAVASGVSGIANAVGLFEPKKKTMTQAEKDESAAQLEFEKKYVAAQVNALQQRKFKLGRAFAVERKAIAARRPVPKLGGPAPRQSKR